MGNNESKTAQFSISVRWYYVYHGKEAISDEEMAKVRKEMIKNHDLREDEAIEFIHTDSFRVTITEVKIHPDIDVGFFVVDPTIPNKKYVEEMRSYAVRHNCNVFPLLPASKMTIENLPKSIQDAIQDQSIND